MKKFRFILLLVAMLAMLPVAKLIAAGDPVDSVIAGKGLAILCCSLVFALFCAAFTMSVISGRIVISPVIRGSLFVFLWALIFFGIAYLVVKLTSGVFSLAAYIGAPALIAAIYLLLFYRGRKKAANAAAAGSVRRSAASTAEVKYDYKLLFGALIVMLVVAILALCLGQSCKYLWIAIAFACGGFLLWRLLFWRFFLLLGFLGVELCALVFCVPMVKSGEMSSFWRITTLTFLYMSLLAPLADLYCKKEPIA